MKILVVSATEHELNLSALKNKKKTLETDVLISGIGIASATYHITKRLMKKKYDIAIQAGIAGTFKSELNFGETVFVSADAFGDLGIEENGIFKNLFVSKLAGKDDFPFKDGWLVNHHKLLNSGLLKTVKAVTVNKITTDREHVERQKNFFNAHVESMEGAAFHYVCLNMNTPFLQLRSISNEVGERDKTKWRLTEAIGSLNNELSKTIQLFSK
jgi:futalosine hydrolase